MAFDTTGHRKTKYPRLMIAAPSSGTGKTTVTCGLLAAFLKKGMRLQSFKCGPDYIDPMYHQKVLGIPSKNLDTYFTDRVVTTALFEAAAKDAELSVVEGVMGYYDGVAGKELTASSYDLADTLDMPVVLVMNGKGMSRSICAMINGYVNYAVPSHIAGILLNRCSKSLYMLLKPMIEEQCGVPVYGYIEEQQEFTMESRHLGLKLPEEMTDLQGKIDAFAKHISETVDLNGLYELAQKAPELEETDVCELWTRAVKASISEEHSKETVTIAVARDEAFGFYYEDNLRLLEQCGAVLEYFSPLHDTKLPEADGLYIGGGYPELYLEQLAGNYAMKDALREAAKDKMPIWAECGGYMYLLQSIEQGEKRFEMAGVLDGNAYDTGKLCRFGYIEIQPEEDDGLPGPIKAHEFHYYDSKESDCQVLAVKPVSGRNWKCLHVTEHIIAGFPHLYLPSAPAYAVWLVERCRKYKEK